MSIKGFTLFSVVIVCTILLAYSMGNAATIYVDAANQGEEEGSKAKPFNTIQEGIDAAQSGDTVQVVAGDYEEDDVKFKDGITLQGAGAEVTKIIVTADYAGSIIDVTNVKSGVIDGFTIDGGGAGEKGFYLSRSEVKITNNIVTNTKYRGLDAWSSKPTISKNQFVKNLGTGIYLKRSDAIVTGNKINENGEGIFCEAKANATIADNEIFLNQGYGISLSGSAPTIRNNQITDNDSSGIYAESRANATIEENTISANGYCGIGGSSSDLTIRKNDIMENAAEGIKLSASDPTISENEIVGNWYGIWLASISGGSVSHNTIEESGESGIYISGGTTVITDNASSMNAKAGIYCDSSSPTIERNTVTDNSGCGVDCGGSANPTIVNNTISLNSGEGINLSQQAGATITGNQITGNTDHGIGIWSTNHGGIIIAGNRISDNTDGVYIYQDQVISTSVQIKDNQIIDNSGNGIVNYRGRAQIRGNLIKDNRGHGVWMRDEGTIPDLGTVDDQGNNAIYDNRHPLQLINETPHEIQAVSNYWGKGTEEKGPKELIASEEGGQVIFEPWLKEEPPPPFIPSSVLYFTWPTHNVTGYGPFQIAWKDDNPETGTLSLYYNTDRVGHDGTAIPGAANIPLSDTENSYLWQPSGLTQGITYYIYAEIDDGTGELSYVYSIGGITLGGVATTASYRLSLDSGLHMISLPLMPSQPYTARSFAELFDASLVVEYDEDNDKFSAYIPVVATTEGFTIKGAHGYIVNLPEAKEVTFTGAAWSAAPAKPQENPTETLWAFAVGGVLPKGIEANQLTLLNPRNGWRTSAESQGSGRFGAVLVGAEGDSVVTLGDTLEIHQNERMLARQRVTALELRLAYGIVTLRKQLPLRTRLLANYPNPFNPETWIPYQLAKPGEVTIRIYDLQGRLVREFALGYQPAGVYTDKTRAIHWDGANTQGEHVGSGVYFYQLAMTESLQSKFLNHSATRRMVVVK